MAFGPPASTIQHKAGSKSPASSLVGNCCRRLGYRRLYSICLHGLVFAVRRQSWTYRYEQILPADASRPSQRRCSRLWVQAMWATGKLSRSTHRLNTFGVYCTHFFIDGRFDSPDRQKVRVGLTRDKAHYVRHFEDVVGVRRMQPCPAGKIAQPNSN